MIKKQRKNTRELMKEAREEGLFKEAHEMEHTKKTYEFRSAWDGIVTVFLFIATLIIITLVRKGFNL